MDAAAFRCRYIGRLLWAVTSTLNNNPTTIMKLQNLYFRRHALRQIGAATLLPFLGSAVAKSDDERKRQIAVTIDDGPAVGANSDLELFLRITNGIRDTFVSEKVPAIMFVNEQQLNVAGQRDDRARVLDAWLQAGLELGNHTYSHKDLKKLELWQYYDEIAKGEVITRPLLKSIGQDLIWFRYPFLSTESGEKAAAVEAYLKQHDYRIAPVTVDYADYSFASNYARALRAGDNARADEIVGNMMAALDIAFEKSETQSKNLLGYELPLVLLIHCNELNAKNLRLAITAIRKRGYEFVSLDQAMQDPAYHTPNLPAGTMGGNFFAGLAKAIDK
jgi:peptidoglycan/xylan/chitin deacetylase (PgdA/CDA1 family)